MPPFQIFEITRKKLKLTPQKLQDFSVILVARNSGFSFSIILSDPLFEALFEKNCKKSSIKISIRRDIRHPAVVGYPAGCLAYGSHQI